MSKAKELVPESACKRLEELREIASQPDATLDSAFFGKIREKRELAARTQEIKRLIYFFREATKLRVHI